MHGLDVIHYPSNIGSKSNDKCNIEVNMQRPTKHVYINKECALINELCLSPRRPNIHNPRKIDPVIHGGNNEKNKLFGYFSSEEKADELDNEIYKRSKPSPYGILQKEYIKSMNNEEKFSNDDIQSNYPRKYILQHEIENYMSDESDSKEANHKTIEKKGLGERLYNYYDEKYQENIIIKETTGYTETTNRKREPRGLSDYGKYDLVYTPRNIISNEYKMKNEEKEMKNDISYIWAENEKYSGYVPRRNILAHDITHSMKEVMYGITDIADHKNGATKYYGYPISSPHHEIMLKERQWMKDRAEKENAVAVLPLIDRAVLQRENRQLMPHNSNGYMGYPNLRCIGVAGGGFGPSLHHDGDISPQKFSSPRAKYEFL